MYRHIGVLWRSFKSTIASGVGPIQLRIEKNFFTRYVDRSLAVQPCVASNRSGCQLQRPIFVVAHITGIAGYEMIDHHVHYRRSWHRRIEVPIHISNVLSIHRLVVIQNLS